MGVTQHVCGTENVQGIVDLALARGNVGRPGAGLMPIRGHSGVQGGAEMGAYATALPGGLPVTPENARVLAERYGFDVPALPGLTAAEMVEAGGPVPRRRRSLVFGARRRSATRSRRSSRHMPGSSVLPKAATRSSGAGATCARAGVSRPQTAARISRMSCPSPCGTGRVVTAY